MSIAVGIDLGTTNTVVAAVRDGVAFTIADPNGRRLIPSTVSFHPSGNVLVGQPAIDRRLIDPENTVYSVKRLIGRGFQTDEVQKARARFAFKMKEGPKSGTIIMARGEEYTLPEISAFVLRYAKATAEAALGVPVDRAVITVPANFNDLQRAATKVAGKLAGLDVLRILNEPTAAALAYGQGAGEQGRLVQNPGSAGKGERVAVYDLGGGTFDITLLDLSGNVFEVLATAGDTSLGGDDFDNLIAERMAEELLKKHRYDARTNPTAIGTLRMVAESMKRELSSREDTSVQLNDLAFGEGGRALPFSFRMTRPELEWTSLALVDRTFKVCQSALERAGLRIDQINRVILVGGSTRMPLVARRVEQFWKQQPVMRVNPDEVVALGAAIQAGALDRAGVRRRAPGAPAPASTPNIAEDSIVAPLPLRPAHAARDDEPMPTLPLVTGAKSDPRMVSASRASRGGTLPLVRKPDPRVDEDESTAMGEQEGLPIVGSVGRMKPAAQTIIEPDPIVPIGVGDLDFDLPPPPPPRPPRHEDSVSMSRPLVFDLPPSQPPPALAPEPRPQGQSRAGAPPPPPARAAPPPPPARAAQPRLDPPTPYVPLVPAPAMPSEPPPKPPLLIDVTPLSLSVETVGGFCDQLIDANTPVPCDRTRVFLTASDNQTAVFIRVAQGESKKFGENTFLGELELSGLVPQRRGELQIAVTFEIDADGILNVRAKDVKAGRETKARMHLFGAQTEEHEIEAMRARQARHAVDGPLPAGAGK